MKKNNILKLRKILKKPQKKENLREFFATNSLGASIIIIGIVFICISGIFSLFIEDSKLHFLREILRAIECIIVSIISYFFGGMVKK